VRGFTLWLTGLPGSGKTTLAHTVAEELRKAGVTRMEILDGDVIRTNLSKGLGFSKEDRDSNIQRIAFVCKLLTRNDVVVIAAAVSPYRESREHARKEIGQFVEVFVHCPLEVLIQRDPKGLYKRAMEGSIQNLSGISDPYEEPVSPEIVVETAQETIAQSTGRILAGLKQMGFI